MDYLEQDLKHYGKYLRKLTAFANSLGLKVIYRSEQSDGLFVPSKRKVVIDRELGEANTIAVFLHELGHAVQHYFGTYHYKDVGKLHKAYESNKPTRSQVKLRTAYEREAWENGALVAQALNIRLGTWYDNIAKYYLKSFRR